MRIAGEAAALRARGHRVLLRAPRRHRPPSRQGPPGHPRRDPRLRRDVASRSPSLWRSCSERMQPPFEETRGSTPISTLVSPPESPHRTAYRGLDVLAVYLEARRRAALRPLRRLLAPPGGGRDLAPAGAVGREVPGPRRGRRGARRSRPRRPGRGWRPPSGSVRRRPPASSARSRRRTAPAQRVSKATGRSGSTVHSPPLQLIRVPSASRAVVWPRRGSPQRVASSGRPGSSSPSPRATSPSG